MRFLLGALVVLAGVSAAAAAPVWRTLPDAPIAGAGRHDDVFFHNEDIGWVCNLNGEIWKTTNGGLTWVAVLDTLEAFRCITFVDSLRGWAGSLYSVNLLWETFDGGETWSVVPNIPNPRPAGLCGMWPVNANVVYGVSRYDGTPTLIKTIDGGATWQSLDMSAYASTLIDCYFVSADSGFAVGGIGAFQSDVQSRVLSTGDGGATWSVRWTGPRLREWGWKISFPTPTVGYVSLESSNGYHYVLKSTDGGTTWSDSYYGSGSAYREQGIGFATPTLGWLGGSASLARETTDGGITWNPTDWGVQLNRVFMLSDTLGYAVGASVYKYSEDAVTDAPIAQPPRAPDLQLALHQNEPNPFNPTTTIRYVIDADATIRLLVYDVNGRMVRKLVDQLERAGEHVVAWDGRDTQGTPVASGLYFYRLQSDDFAEVRKMTLLK